MRIFISILAIVASSNLFAAESILFDRRTDVAPGVAEKIFKDAGYNLFSEFNNKPSLHVVFSHSEPKVDNRNVWVWSALYMANYVCPLKEDKILILGGIVQNTSEALTNPTIQQGNEKLLNVHKIAAKNLLAQIKGGGLDESKQQCAWLQNQFR